MTPVTNPGYVVSGRGRNRKFRFQDGRSNPVPLAGMIFAPYVLVTTILRKLFGYSPVIPWISNRARRRIADTMQPDWVVLETGSGMSTVWLAQRCELLHSIEHDQVWYDRVQERLAARDLTNVNQLLCGRDNYCHMSAFPDRSFDFVLIDSIRRTDCVKKIVPKIKEGGWLFMDCLDWGTTGMAEDDYSGQEAGQILLEMAARNDWTVEYYTDMTPSSFWATQGMLVQIQKEKDRD